MADLPHENQISILAVLAVFYILAPVCINHFLQRLVSSKCFVSQKFKFIRFPTLILEDINWFCSKKEWEKKATVRPILTITAWKVSKYGVISGPYFHVLGLSTEIYGVDLCIQSEYRKIRTRNTPYLDTFYAVDFLVFEYSRFLITNFCHSLTSSNCHHQKQTSII